MTCVCKYCFHNKSQTQSQATHAVINPSLDDENGMEYKVNKVAADALVVSPGHQQPWYRQHRILDP